MFDHKDRVTLVKADGTRIENIPSDVQPKMIFIDDASVPVEEGDRFVRTLPNKLVESYVVLDRGFFSDAGGFGDHYQIKVRKESSPPPERGATVFNLHGMNARVNIHSTDNSSNVAHHDNEQVFEALRETIRSRIPSGAQEPMLANVEQLERTKGTVGFLSAYKEFIATAADHITIITPFIPALSAWLGA